MFFAKYSFKMCHSLPSFILKCGCFSQIELKHMHLPNLSLKRPFVFAKKVFRKKKAHFKSRHGKRLHMLKLNLAKRHAHFKAKFGNRFN